eukprot:TRINITY_DN5468_c0_g1_i1.p1 TRINITY_DN5468_c0_g1~~TRINITY_DN5468_c0_g1_i1.p1  ORF type:complete len:468 (+),score=99.73 TRINITY_DN5468_c0_g1_i1:340-1743(+)
MTETIKKNSFKRTSAPIKGTSFDRIMKRSSSFDVFHRQGDNGILAVRVLGVKDHLFQGKGPKRMLMTFQTTFGRQAFKTAVFKRGTDPVWDSSYKFVSESLDGFLTVSLFSAKKGKHRHLVGEAVLDLLELKEREPNNLWLSFEFINKKILNLQARNPGSTYKVHLLVYYSGTAHENVPDYGEQRPSNIYDYYHIRDPIGEGAFSQVRKGIHKKTGKTYAVKMIDITKQTREEIAKLNKEIDIINKLKSDYIIELHETFQDNCYIYMVLELATGGELFDFVVSKGRLSEEIAGVIIKQLLEGVQYMHSKGIAHRDLKLENILLTDTEDLTIKISDFGLSKDFSSDVMITACGTPEYVAPEVLLSEPYDQAADIWSIGVIAYMLLSGKPPFWGENNQEIFRKVLRLDYTFNNSVWRTVSDEAKEFVSVLLIDNPDLRPTARECLASPWMLEVERMQLGKKKFNWSAFS